MPINTLQNWLAEFNMWLPYEDPNSAKSETPKKPDQKQDIKEESNHTDISSLSSRSMSTDSRSHQDLPQSLPTPPNLPGQFQNFESPQMTNFYPDMLKTPETTPQTYQMYPNMPQYPHMKQELDPTVAYPPQFHPIPGQIHPQSFQPSGLQAQPSQYQTYPQPLPQDQKPQDSSPPIKKEPEEPLTKEEGTSTSKDESDDKKTEKVATPFNVDAPLGLETRPRHFNLHILNDSHKTMAARARVIKEWQKVGFFIVSGVFSSDFKGIGEQASF